MFQFFGPKFLDCGAQFRLLIAKNVHLCPVMFIDRLFYGHRAGHGCSLAQGRGGGTQRVAGQVPKWQKGRRPHAALGDQARERIEVMLLLRLHMADHVAMPAAPQHRQLALIDALRAIFPGMIDAYDAFHLRTQIRLTWETHRKERPLLRDRQMARQDETARA